MHNFWKLTREMQVTGRRSWSKGLFRLRRNILCFATVAVHSSQHCLIVGQTTSSPTTAPFARACEPTNCSSPGRNRALAVPPPRDRARFKRGLKEGSAAAGSAIQPEGPKAASTNHQGPSCLPAFEPLGVRIVLQLLPPTPAISLPLLPLLLLLLLDQEEEQDGGEDDDDGGGGGCGNCSSASGLRMAGPGMGVAQPGHLGCSRAHVQSSESLVMLLCL